jgi:hypothetical protein
MPVGKLLFFGMVFYILDLLLISKLENMRMSNKGSLLMLGLGALAIYKYNKMSDDQKSALKDKVKKFYDDNLSPLVKNALSMAGQNGAMAQSESAK